MPYRIYIEIRRGVWWLCWLCFYTYVTQRTHTLFRCGQVTIYLKNSVKRTRSPHANSGTLIIIRLLCIFHAPIRVLYIACDSMHIVSDMLEFFSFAFFAVLLIHVQQTAMFPLVHPLWSDISRANIPNIAWATIKLLKHHRSVHDNAMNK